MWSSPIAGTAFRLSHDYFQSQVRPAHFRYEYSHFLEDNTVHNRLIDLRDLIGAESGISIAFSL